ncbi:S1C family serine protease [Flavobacterium orientale]|uniref:Serine protease n=1 Tax=Flavobacterium orientale TaxID=1756020 RepID=A0A916Y483_9FLAO|nr:trypsin-like peptidase domain-containing protein [Flavobacterium orientale]GGD30024.1 serine protease [Flavobacterium orientale]
MRNTANLFFVALLSGIITLGSYKLFVEENNASADNIITSAPSLATKTVGLTAEAIDFTEAAESTLNQVVHVKNVSYRTISNPIMEFMYGQRGGQQQQQIGTGSGVIISEDGYIVTNNHVINGAQDLEVTLNNKKTYKAKLIGTDSKMDIALLKVEADEKLPYIVFADSDHVRVGEWVLAVGNPYNLNSTVTAGIVSAKARNLDTRGIQSFIQTDAVVNPGNSGGALVNTRGELVGINTMISSNTGSYVGYSFAVPSNITRKIIEDIMEFGNVQRGILGIEGVELNGVASREFKVEDTQGFYVNKVTKNSGAEKAGIKSGDVIKKLDNQTISSFAELSGYINTKRPNDEIKVTVSRNGKTVVIPVVLSKKELLNYEFYGLELEDLDASDKQRFKINQGVKIKDITNEKLAPYSDELKGSIILSIDGVKATDVETISRGLGSKTEKEGVRVELLLRNGQLMRIII